MRTWEQYKKTFKQDPDIFDFARFGDLRGLAELIQGDACNHLDAKNNKGYSALMLAVYNGQNDFCEALLRCGANVNSHDKMENTPLMAAAFKGNLEMVKLLIQFGADTNARNRAGISAYDWAVLFGQKPIQSYFEGNAPKAIISSSKIKYVFNFLKLGIMAIKLFTQKKAPEKDPGHS